MRDFDVIGYAIDGEIICIDCADSKTPDDDPIFVGE